MDLMREMQIAATVAAAILATWAVYTANPMFPVVNRPEILRGLWGTALFSFLTGLTMLAMLSLLVWSFRSLAWWLVPPLLAGGVAVGALTHRHLPMILACSALGYGLFVVGLLGLHWLAWTVLRP